MSDVAAIRDHYDRLSVYYRTLWGEHIHHGYWDGDAPPAEAQVRLIERLAALAEIPRGCHVLDVGCGLGGSTRWLAREWECTALGITLSPVQARMATEQAHREGLDGRVRFEVMDANHLDLPAPSFDAVWVVECSEHLADKPRFLAECARVLKPGGRLALCAWLAGEHLTPQQRALVDEVCEGMLCPSLGTLSEYRGWMEAAGFQVRVAEDVCPRVAATWDRCSALVEKPWVRALLHVTDERVRSFVHSFTAIRRAYHEGAMGYGMFAAALPWPQT